MDKHTKIIRQLLSANCLTVFDNFAGLALKGLKDKLASFMFSSYLIIQLMHNVNQFTGFYVMGTSTLNRSN